MLGEVEIDCLVGLPVVKTSEVMIETLLEIVTDMIPMVPGVVS